ncbi:LLM class F420-dependent oxidoreductase [Rhodococcus sp. NPDC058521]|uniref:LLM class F420-dependent oxidoreductase n=1 Tax=Rhodococcus sp. NPDC058521 TaxID=3346536 RepID=UPI003654980B
MTADTDSTSTPDLGQFGIWRGGFLKSDAARSIEELGYGTIWIGGSPPADLEAVEKVLDATETITVATGIVNIWTATAHDIADTYHRFEQKYPGRFLLGIGVGHPEQPGLDYSKPYSALVEYLEVLDERGVPAERRVLAALGPKVLELSAARSAGAHPYLTTPEHTRQAREHLGRALLAPEQKVVLDDDAARARSIGRDAVDNPYLHLKNYVNNLKRLGYTEAEIAGGGSDRLIDDLVAHGTAQQVAARLNEHVRAGADHVAIQILPASDDPVPVLRELATVLNL